MSDLSNVEALLLAQAVWELGANAWHDVAGLLSGHPLISRPKNFFTPASCHTMHAKLMTDAHLLCNTDSSDAVHGAFYLHDRIPSLSLLSPRKFEACAKVLSDTAGRTQITDSYGGNEIQVCFARRFTVAPNIVTRNILGEVEAIRSGRWNDQANSKASEVDASPPREEDAKVRRISYARSFEYRRDISRLWPKYSMNPS